MTDAQLDSLTRALREKFGGDVDVEAVNGGGRYRLAVVSDRFASMTHLQRQEALWQVVDDTLPSDARLDVSLILAYAPDDLAAAE